MRFTRDSLNGIKYYCFVVSLIIIIGCQSTVQKPKPDSVSHSTPLVVTQAKSSNEEIETIKKELQFQTSKIKEIEQKLNTYQTKIIDQSSVIDKNDVNNNELLKLKHELKLILDKFQTESIEQNYLDNLNKIQKKIQILEDRTFFTDSLYFEIVTDMVMIENKISSLLLSFKEMNDLSMNKITKVIPKITDEEYTAKYIESLSYYQNAEWEKSLNGFNYLIQVDNNHDLADNCQYWIGEVYYALSDYRRSIREFKKVLSFPGTNKADDSQFKLGLCYMNLSQTDKAIQEFNKLMEYYPNSEYYKRAQNYLQQY